MEPENSPSTDIRSIQDIANPTNEYDQPQYQKKSSLAKIAGILLMITGIIILLHWVYIITSPDFITIVWNTGVYNNMNITREDLSAVFNVCGTLAIMLSFFTIMGGFMAFHRRRFWLALIGGIVGIFAIAPIFLFIPNMVSLIGVIIVFTSRKEFQ